MANLAEYLVNGKLSAAEISRRTGIRPPTLSKIKHGKFRPSMEMVLRCYVATGGEVTVKDTLPDLTYLMNQVTLQVAVELEKRTNANHQNESSLRAAA